MTAPEPTAASEAKQQNLSRPAFLTPGLSYIQTDENLRKAMGIDALNPSYAVPWRSRDSVGWVEQSETINLHAFISYEGGDDDTVNRRR
jgi:hypothetical protein